MHHSSQFKILLHLKDIWDLTISFLNNQLIWTYARRDTCFQGTTLPSRIYFVISLTNSYFGSAGKEPTSHPVNIPSLFFLNQHMQKPKNTFCCTRITNHIHTWYIWASNTNHTPKPCPGILIKLGLVFGKGQGVGHDICAFVYFHSIVFCLDFHQGERYLRKRGRKWDENKGRGREPSVMELVPHWSRFSRTHTDMAPRLLLMAADIHESTFYLFIYLEWKHKQPNKIMNGGGDWCDLF